MRRPLSRGVLPFLLASMLSMSLSTAAFADNLQSDGDLLASGVQDTLAFGDVCVGSTTSKSATITAVRQGGSGPNTYANSATVAVSVVSFTGSGLTATMLADSTIVLPSDWNSGGSPSADNGKVSTDSASASVTFVAGATGAFSGSVIFRGTASPVQRDDTMPVTANVINCDTAAPILNLPGPITAEATGPTGATVTFVATATDANPTNPAVTCVPASGSTFPLGATTVNCSATDAVGNTANGSFSVTVVDTTAPTVTPPANVTLEATGPDGATVTYGAATATDAVSGSLPATCAPLSGSTFALGTTTVTCTATDGAGNTGSAGFSVTIEDTTAPLLTVPADDTLEATGPDGAVATFSATASDLVDGDVTPNCLPASGSTFALGTTTVTCTATDSAGNSTSDDFDITVEDTTPPDVTAPADETAEATGPSGATVTYGTATATDIVDGSISPTCLPASGSTFPLGNTTVTCQATDGAGNTGSDTFTVSVVDTTAPVLTLPADQLLEATSAAGAVATFVASALDLVDGSVAVLCDATSGDTFPLGTTTVNCTATDAALNTAMGSFTITVEDTTAPETTIDAGPSGWITVDSATFDVSGSDLVTAAGDLVFSHRLDGGAWSAFDGDTSIELTGLAEGAHTFEVAARDEAGNVDGSPDSQSFSVDTIAPTIVPGDLIDPIWRNTPLSQSFTASDGGSGLAPNAALDALGGFTLTASAESDDASTPTTDSLTVFDVAGNSTTRTLSALIDVTDPTISATLDRSPAGTGWFNASTGAPTLDYTCDDLLSGLAAGSSCPDHPFGEGEDQSHSTTVFDLAGNSATAGVTDVDVDLTAPSLNISGGAGGALELCGGTPTRPTSAPTDALSGLDGTEGDSWVTPAGGSGVGTYTYEAHATDEAGNTTSETRVYTVAYGAAFGGILQPINADGTSRFKLGSTIPVKFRLTCDGVAVSTAVAKLTVKQGDTAPDPGVDEAVSTAASTTGNLFRYSEGQYIFNLSTKQGYLNPGASTTTAFAIGTWTLGIHLDDGTSRTVKIQLVK